ncbi:uncharacterized protein FOMMEDRAFT_152189 [Fomitiporia mediterranea MF3/22]|uniref:uncharacterized protein n=1 Tax=Fomitiporia mediterranea (strain MF3/22) TaxID=694068 RepID=UPI0004409A8A|nr:uncharacterized protein FOMMEDRAFT_152189 [Fomitiporia mediterranea MF3/22]EJD06866.1 hypothetical protein FOMMEDRAFT_152189 [Fomitiporia mediterranea MF3/22]
MHTHASQPYPQQHEAKLPAIDNTYLLLRSGFAIFYIILGHLLSPSIMLFRNLLPRSLDFLFLPPHSFFGSSDTNIHTFAVRCLHKPRLCDEHLFSLEEHSDGQPIPDLPDCRIWPVLWYFYPEETGSGNVVIPSVTAATVLPRPRPIQHVDPKPKGSSD